MKEILLKCNPGLTGNLHEIPLWMKPPGQRGEVICNRLLQTFAFLHQQTYTCTADGNVDGLEYYVSFIRSDPLYISQERDALYSLCTFFADGVMFYLIVYKWQQG